MMPFEVALKLAYFHALDMSSVLVGGVDFWQDASRSSRAGARKRVMDMVGICIQITDLPDSLPPFPAIPVIRSGMRSRRVTEGQSRMPDGGIPICRHTSIIIPENVPK
jgi:hypothetical protein